MPVELKDALEIFGLTPEDLTKAESTETLKADVDKTWVKLATAHNNPIVKSAVTGTWNRAGRKKLEEVNARFELGLEIGDKDDLLDLFPKLSEVLQPKFDDFKGAAEKLKNSAPKDVVDEYENKLKEKDKKLTAIEKSAKEAQTKYDELFNNVQTKEKTAKVDGEWGGAMGSITFSPQVDALRKEGFSALMRKEYQVLIDDEGKTYAANAKGEPLMHPKKAAERWPLAEALKAKAEELKLIGANPQGGKQIIQTPTQRQQEVAPPGRFGRGERKQPDRIM